VRQAGASRAGGGKQGTCKPSEHAPLRPHSHLTLTLHPHPPFFTALQDAAKPESENPDAGPHAGQLMLLKGITGSFRAGVLTALMVGVWWVGV